MHRWAQYRHRGGGQKTGYEQKSMSAAHLPVYLGPSTLGFMLKLSYLS
jgi:hypothetical protein